MNDKLQLEIGYQACLYIKKRCSPATSLSKQHEIQYRCSTPEEKIRQPTVSDKSVDDLLNGCTLINDTFDGDRSSTPLPSPAWESTLFSHQKHPSVRSILQDSKLDDASFASSVHRRSPRRAASSNSFREPSPTRSVASNISVNQSRR